VTAIKTGPAEPPAAIRAVAALQAELPELPRDADGPVFKAPWQAQAFAMTLALHERGEFTWAEWAQTLAAVIGEVKQRGESDTGEHYYGHWLTALERIAAKKDLVTASLLLQRRREWEEAAHRTPHGQPIQLQSSGSL
jgi:nitrile hydratase accessory protein